MIIVISFFAHGVKEININRYRVHLRVLPTNSVTDIYQHSDVVLKHMPKDVLKTLFYRKKKIVLPAGQDRRMRKVNATNAAKSATKSAYCYISEFYQLKNNFRVSLWFLTDIDIVNPPVKLDAKIIFTLETELPKLLE